MQPYASDALEDAMRLAQTKALNSYSYSDELNYLNYAWMDIYQRIAQMDEGYYSLTERITQKVTKLPPFVKNTVRVYAAQSPVGFNREVYRSSGMNDLVSPRTYHISGFDLYCPDAPYRTIWLNYIPMQKQIFFTMNNRDPKLYDAYEVQRDPRYNLQLLNAEIITKTVTEVNKQPTDIPSTNTTVNPSTGVTTIIVVTLTATKKVTTITVITPVNIETALPSRLAQVNNWYLKPRNVQISGAIETNLTEALKHGDGWELRYISCDFPYLFVTWCNVITDEYHSGFYTNLLKQPEFTEYNPFDYTGRNSNVEYVSTHWNDKTGMGVVVIDHNDNNKIKELGWTPDTMLVYPAPEVYRFLVAKLADKFSALNEGQAMAVSKELVEAQYAFDMFLKKDKSAWSRIDNVNGATIGDLL
jgi:hypothetical protein